MLRNTMRNSAMRRRWLAGATMAVAGMGLVAQPQGAGAELYWDADGATAGAGGPMPVGTWGVDNFWSTDASGLATTGAWAAGQTAVFAAGFDATGPYIVTLSGTQTIGGITFEEGEVTLQGGALQINGNTPFSISPSLLATIDTNIPGSGRLVKEGAGTLVLNVTNTYSGGTNFNAGTIAVTADSRLGASSGELVFNGGALRFDAAFSLSASRAITLDSGGGTFSTNGNDAAINSSVSGVGGLTKNGFGVLTLSGANSFSGGMTINQGTVVANTGGSIPLGGAVTVQLGGTLQVQAGATINLSGDGNVIANGALTLQGGDFFGSISGASSVTKSGPGTAMLSGTSTYSGGTNFNAGTLAVTSDAALGDSSGGLSFDGGTLRFETEFSLSSTRAIVINGGGGTFNTNGFETTITQAILGLGTLTKTGFGTLVLANGANGIDGVRFNGGTIAVASDGALGVGTGELQFFGGALRYDAGFSISPARAITINTSGTFDTNGFVAAIDPAIGGAGTLVKEGAGTLQLGNTANSYSGGTFINAGTLQAAAGSLPTVGVVTVQSGATLDVPEGATIGLSGGGSVIAGGPLELQGGNFSGSISGTANLIKSGAGTQVLSGTNTYSGGTTLNTGTLAVTSDAALGASGSGVVFNGGTMRFNANATLSSSRTITLDPVDITTTFDTNGFNVSVNSLVTGSGLLVKSGSGTLALTNTANSFSSAVIVLGGTLALAADEPLGSSGGIGLQGTLRFDAPFALAPGRSISLNGGPATFDTNGFDITLDNWILGSGGSLVKAGNGVLTLTNTGNAYAGTTITGGTLAVSSDGALGMTTGGITFNGGTFRFDVPVELSSSRAITLNAAGGRIDTNGFNIGLDLVVGGLGALVKVGSGTLVVTNTANNYSGGTTILNGAIAVQSNAQLGASSGGILLDGGTLHTDASISFSRTFTLGVGGGTIENPFFNDTISGTITGTGGLVKTGSGTLTLTNTANTYSGGTTITGGTLQVASDAILGPTSGGVTFNGGTLALGATGELSFFRPITMSTPGGTIDTGAFNIVSNSKISGVGGLTKTGSGTLMLNRVNTYSGGTTINAGTLVLEFDALGTGGLTFNGGNLRFDASFVLPRAVTLSAAGTFNTNGNNNTVSGSISGSGALTKSGTGTLALTNTANSYSGGTFINAGTLLATSPLSLPSGGAVTMQTSTMLDVPLGATIGLSGGPFSFVNTDGALNLQGGTFSGSISGTGSVTKIGPGIQRLNGASSYSGGTNFNVGTLQVAGDSSLGASSGSLTFNGGTFRFDGISGDLIQPSRVITLNTGGGTFEINGPVDPFPMSVVILGPIHGIGGLVKTGPADLQLDSTSSTYSGGTTINSGRIVLTLSDAPLGAPTSGITINGGGLYFLGPVSVSSSRTITLNAAATFKTEFLGAAVGSNISGTGALNKTGFGPLTLTGTNTYSGGTTIEPGGTLLIGDGGTSGSIIGNVINSGGLIFNRSDDSSFGGSISGAGTVTKRGAGVLTLAGSNSYGPTNFDGGTIAITSDANLGASSGGLNFNGGAVRFDASVVLPSSRAITLNAGGGTFNTNANNNAVSGPVSGSGGLTKMGSGTLELSNANTYTGPTAVNAGTLRFTQSFRSSASLTVADGATFVLTPRSAGVKTLQVGNLNLNASGTLDLADNDLVVDNGNFSNIFAKMLEGFDNPTGITSSSSDGSQILALFDNALVGASDWNGSPIGANAIVGKYTYFGDMNIDGQVTGDDYTVVDANLNTDPVAGLEWLSGDTNLDGIVTGDDYTVIDANLGLGVGNPLTPNARLSAVPEPASIGLLLAAAPVGRRRRISGT